MAAMRTPKSDKEAIPVDFSNLDREWIDFPEQLFEACEAEREKTAEIKEKKLKLDQLMSEKSTEIRNNPKEFGIDKITERAIEEVLATEEKVVKRKEQLLTLENELEKRKNVRMALYEKRRALENLVTLYGLGYFAEPKDRTGSGKQLKEDLRQQRKAKT